MAYPMDTMTTAGDDGWYSFEIHNTDPAVSTAAGMKALTAAEQEAKFNLAKDLERRERMNYLPQLVRNDDKYFLIATNGTVETYDSEEQATKASRAIVARDDTAEVVVAKALKYVRIDKPVVVEEID